MKRSLIMTGLLVTVTVAVVSLTGLLGMFTENLSRIVFVAVMLILALLSAIWVAIPAAVIGWFWYMTRSTVRHYLPVFCILLMTFAVQLQMGRFWFEVNNSAEIVPDGDGLVFVMVTISLLAAVFGYFHGSEVAYKRVWRQASDE